MIIGPCIGVDYKTNTIVFTIIWSTIGVIMITIVGIYWGFYIMDFEHLMYLSSALICNSYIINGGILRS